MSSVPPQGWWTRHNTGHHGECLERQRQRLYSMCLDICRSEAWRSMNGRPPLIPTSRSYLSSPILSPSGLLSSPCCHGKQSSSTMRPSASSAGSLWQPHQCQTQPLGYLHRLLRIGYWFYVLVVDTLESLLTWSARTANKPRPRCRLRSFVPGVSYKYDHAATTPATLEGWYPLDCMRRRRMMGVAVHMHIQTTHKSLCLHILDISSSLPGDPRCRFGLPRVCGSTRATCRVWGSPGKPAPIAIFVLLVFTSIIIFFFFLSLFFVGYTCSADAVERLGSLLYRLAPASTDRGPSRQISPCA
ncbi:hypothetical protein M432DRAFT_125650 [Thermoascus aurantiacus ATCC 26904]